MFIARVHDTKVAHQSHFVYIQRAPRHLPRVLLRFHGSGILAAKSWRRAGRFSIASHVPWPWPEELPCRSNNELLVAAALVAAICLRGEPIANTPKVIATIHDSIKLARLVLRALNAG
jgi:hypothetical protein